ncbi:hypothetical protein HMPREF9104_01993 [Lentilactobacillus kisonensis F0435]|uniref:Uncharacterized protein n=1 Tax=Lentilactobacillus kisonensis F0435 TaxID=797516 RepID=H1LHA3_9LACO|nr:hypothetical protein HMPREF9104_01993 [Lentilactobacillus kisonensis F0435]
MLLPKAMGFGLWQEWLRCSFLLCAAVLQQVSGSRRLETAE